jgi:hypothetical protein
VTVETHHTTAIGSRLGNMGNVEKFYPKDAAKSADNVLELAVGNYEEVLLLGWNKEGEMEARATLGLKDGGDILWLLEGFKHKLLSGEYYREETGGVS